MNRLLSSRRIAQYNHDVVNQNTSQIEGDKTAWDHYNERARIDDREYVKDWNENLANLLIFAALFSAILTAFIIESMKLLQEDPQETTNSLLQFMAMQAVNATRPNATVSEYIPSEFTLKSYVVAVNCLFFSSLSLSLLAALASIIILQWVGRYDAGILSYPAAKDRALHRQFRYDGVIRWKMNDLIGALPYLLYFSLVFFFVGMIVWLFNTNQTVSIVVSIFFLVGVAVYAITTIIAVVVPSSPFRTPLSDFFTSLLFQSSTKIREEKKIRETEGFSLHTLMALLETIEIVAHSYSTLTTVAREIVHQPYMELFASRESILGDRWKNIFQTVLSSFSSNIEKDEREQEKLLFESLADYIVSFLVQEAPQARENAQGFFELFPSLGDHNDVRKLATTLSSEVDAKDLIKVPLVYVYSLVLNLPSLIGSNLHEEEILSWLSQTIHFPLEELVTKPLLSETAFQSLLTAVSFLICSTAQKKGLAVRPITSIQEFSTIITSAVDGLAFDYNQTTFDILTSIVTYYCAQLARTKDSHTATKIIKDIEHLMIPHIQEISSYFPIFELVFAYSKCGRWPNSKSSQETLEKVFGLTNEKDGNTCLKILTYLDKLFARPGWHPSQVKEEDAKSLFLHFLFGCGWGWIDPYAYSPAELIAADQLRDPTLRLIASASSGQFLDLNMVNIRGYRHNSLLEAAAAYWVSMALWDKHNSLLSPEELQLLEVLILVPRAYEGLRLKIPAGSENAVYLDEFTVIRKLPRIDISYQRFDQLIMTCNEWSLDCLFRVAEFSHLRFHLDNLLSSTNSALKIFSVIEASQHSLPLATRLFRAFFEVIPNFEDISLVEAACLLWVDILEHGAHDNAMFMKSDQVTRTSLDLHTRLASREISSLWLKERFSQILPRQALFREHQMTLGTVYEGENSIWEWHVDLGFVHQVAFAPEDIWTEWVANIERI